MGCGTSKAANKMAVTEAVAEAPVEPPAPEKVAKPEASPPAPEEKAPDPLPEAPPPAPEEKAPDPVPEAPPPAPEEKAPDPVPEALPSEAAAPATLYKYEELQTVNYLELPRLPIPPLEKTVERYLKHVKALGFSAEELAAHQAVVQEFAEGAGQTLQAQVVDADKHEGYPYSFIEEHWDNMYNGLRCPEPVNVSPYFGISDEKDPASMGQSLRAAQFVHSFTKWTRKVLGGMLEADGGPAPRPFMCSSAFQKMFSSAKLPRVGMDELVCYPEATNVVVLNKGNIFSIEVVLKEEGVEAVLDVPSIQKQMDAILEAPTAEQSIAALTTENRDVWAGLREKLESDEANVSALKKLDAGIIVVCLDDKPYESKVDKAAHLLIGPAQNRWWDKQQLIVGANGSMGICFEHSYSDGTGWGRFIGEVMDDVHGKAGKLAALTMPVKSADLEPEALKFTVQDDVATGIAEATKNYEELLKNVDLSVLDFKEFGKNEIKNWKVSPDAACQMAYQITFYNLHGRLPATYEACAMRAFWHGRTETIRSATTAALDMCEAYAAGSPDFLAKFQVACKTHSGVSKDAITGNGIDRHLLALSKMAEKTMPEDIPKVFSEPILTYSKDFRLSTSNGSAPGLDLFGFGAVSPTGYGVGYLISNNDISFGISSYFDCEETSSETFMAELQNVLCKLKEICNGPAEAPPAPAEAPAPQPAPASEPEPVAEAVPVVTDKCMVLVLNCGSSSLKYALFDLQSNIEATCIVSGLVEKIGLASGMVSLVDEASGEKTKIEMPITDHKAGLDKVMELLMDPAKGKVQAATQIKAVGHRVVHGGEKFTAAAVITDEVIGAIKEAAALAPLHNPANLTGIAVAQQLFPCPQVAVFDTAFHMTMKPEAFLYALPIKLYKEEGIRRYGFHGTSYLYVTGATAAALEREVENTNLIVCHLGNGSSMCAIKNGKCVDTTMGLTPLEGLCMGTRAGDVDPAVHRHLFATKGMSPDEVDKMLNKQSGLLGLCGDSDMRAIQERADAGDADAINALGVFVHRVRKYVGAYLVALGGHVDALVFTAGIGENSKRVRELVCESLEPLGLSLDKDKNATAKGLSELQSKQSRCKIMVVPTNEELSITMQSAEICGIMPTNKSSQVLDGRRATRCETAKLMGRTMTLAKEASVASDLGNIGQGANSTMLLNISDEGTALAEIGLMYRLMPKVNYLGYFRPFSDEAGPEGIDSHVHLLKEVFVLQDDPMTMTCLSKSKAMEMMAQGKMDEMIDMIVSAYEAYKVGKDFILVGQMSFPVESMDINVKVANDLGIPVTFLTTCREHSTVQSIYQEVSMSKGELKDNDNNVKLLGVFVNRVPPEKLEDFTNGLTKTFAEHDIELSGCLPSSPKLRVLCMDEVSSQLQTKVLYGAEAITHGLEAQDIIVATGTVAHIMKAINDSPSSLIVVDGTRHDLILALFLAFQSTAVAVVSGVLITGCDELDPVIKAVLDGIPTQYIPVMAVKEDIWETIDALKNVGKQILPTAHAKIDTAIMIAEEHIKEEWLQKAAYSHSEVKMTPKLFQYSIMSKARAQLMHIVLPEGDDKRVVAAAGILVRRKLCRVTLLGKPDKVMTLASQSGADLSGVTVIDPETADDAEELAELLFKAREKKGMTREKALDLTRGDPNFYGTLMMQRGDAHGMVSGACHTTADTMRPALQIIKTAPGFSLVSSIFFMLLPEQVYVYGDCAINVTPNADQLGNIAASSACTAKAFGIEPRVALLSYSTGESGKGAQIELVKEATVIAKSIAGASVPIEGPIQFDAAVDPEVAKVKVKHASEVAGRASVCVFPDLNTGNNTYKAVQQASGCIAMGPIMQGLRKPVNDLSRGCTIDDIVNTVVITCIQAIEAGASS